MNNEDPHSSKNNFGEILTTSQREPLVIEKNGKNLSVVISFEEFKNYQGTVISDYWGEKAEKMTKNGALFFNDAKVSFGSWTK